MDLKMINQKLPKIKRAKKKRKITLKNL